MSRPGRLRWKLGLKSFAALLLALTLAFGVYLLVYEAGVPWFLYSEGFAPMWEERTQREREEFKDYVEQNRLSSGDGVKLQDWQRAHPALYLFVDDPNADYIDGEFGWLVDFSDGPQFVSFYVSDAYYSAIGRILALVLAALCFLLVVLPCFYRLLRRLTRLSRELELVTAGDLEHRIAVAGRDELSDLGDNIERLRLSVLERIRREQAAVQTNRALVTSLSHDLRTPLTKQIGYLEILQRRMYQSEEERQGYQEQVWKKALQMKDLSDRIFQTFQVGGETAQPPEVVSGNELLGQILEEQAYDLRRQGLTVDLPAFQEGFLLEVSPGDLLRVFDNLFSNLRKYADPACPVLVSCRQTGDEVCIRLENRVRVPEPLVESNGIGLHTVQMLLARNHGRILAGREGGQYHTELFFLKYQAD